MTQFISAEALRSWLDKIAATGTLIAPKQVGEEVYYRPASGSKDVTLTYERPKMSPKEFLWPSTEAMVTVNLVAPSINSPVMEKEQVIFGARPCDARGIKALDAILLTAPADALYQDKRDKTTLVGLSCPRMFTGCFCTSFGSSPADPSALDVMLTAVDGGYAVQAATEKGKKVLALATVTEKDVTVPAPTSDGAMAPVMPVQEWAARFGDPYWAKISERCISCRVCTFVCPTCRCFDVRDNTEADRTVTRLRSWDACQLDGFCRIAGGHNPRPTRQQRLRQRFYCKFSYVPQDFGPLACVGCGRCVVDCPVNIDIREMLTDIQKKA
jgi:sulfhydrogenase subunit beta (sulfur reductase)